MERMPACEVNIPEAMPDFNAPGNIGSWRQILAENIGKQVKIETSVGLDGPLRQVCGEVYFVGSSYVAVIAAGGKVVLTDIFGIKFVTFCCDA